jgi:murein DD-endopeptidase MepM/ murein hydrolase activator NlpD
MSDRLHIIITGDKGKARKLLFSKQKLQLLAYSSIAIFVALSFFSYNAYHFFYSNQKLNQQVSALNTQLSEEQQLTGDLSLQVTNLEELNENQASTFQEEKATLLNTAVSELEERSGLIRRMLDKIGVDLPQHTSTGDSNSGGPYLAPREDSSKELLYNSDRYLETMTYLPIGRPIPGVVTSRFGHRLDPVNGKKGFHSGVDMRGAYGQEIVATANGTVKRSFINGSYGKFVEIDHGNGYITRFAHMKKILVKRGEKVLRGQAVGLLGNTGRSTGPHLHYEVCFNKKPVNPSKFMRVDKLALPAVIPNFTAQNRTKIKRPILAQTQAHSTTPPQEN